MVTFLTDGSAVRRRTLIDGTNLELRAASSKPGRAPRIVWTGDLA